jgi:uncharacterized SAM-binding protein YcdF (DUF218 family)
MFVLHKILPTLILPLGLCLGLLCAALAWRRWILVALALLILLSGSNPWISSFLISRLENRFPKVEIASCPDADAVVVLSGILGKKRSIPQSPELNWGEAYDRFDAGVRLFQAGKAPWLVLFNPGRPQEGLPDFAEGEQLMRSATERGVPPQNICVLGPIGNTADEARMISEVANDRRWRSIILVTTAWHMPRAWERFRKTGVKIHPFPVDFRCDTARRVSVTDFFPTAGAMATTEIFLREWVGRTFYYILDLLANPRK